MLFTLGVGSATALTGCVITVICDQFPHWNKSLVTLGISIISFFIGLAYVTPVRFFIIVLVNFIRIGLTFLAFQPRFIIMNRIILKFHLYNKSLTLFVDTLLFKMIKNHNNTNGGLQA